MLNVDPISKHLEHRSRDMDTPAALVLNNRCEEALHCPVLAKDRSWTVPEGGLPATEDHHDMRE